MTSLRRELSVRIELQESTFLTAEGSDGQTFRTPRLCFGPERFLRLACMPAHEKGSSVRVLRHKPLHHFTFAFWTLRFFVSHMGGSVIGRRATSLTDRSGQRASAEAEDVTCPVTDQTQMP